MKVRTLFKVLCTGCTPIEFVDRNGSRSRNIAWIPLDWRIVKMFISSENDLVIHVDGDFETL